MNAYIVRVDLVLVENGYEVVLARASNTGTEHATQVRVFNEAQKHITAPPEAK